MAAPAKTFQERVCESIIAGDLDSFKSLTFAPGEINRPLFRHKDLRYRPRYHPSEQYIRPRGPTPLILAVLCEQPEIVSHILAKSNPDLSVRVDGYVAHHYAAMIKDFRPLQLLIRCEWVQENIDIPIDLQGVAPASGSFTTALHAAVSGRRLANVFLLVSPFPSIGTTVYQPAAVDQRSATGALPLHIAVAQRDSRTVEALLAAGADRGLRNARGETAEELAERLKTEGAKWRTAGEDSAAGICALLAEPPDVALADLAEKYAPEILAAEAEGGGDEEEEEGAPPPPTPVEPEIEKAPAPGLQAVVDALASLEARVRQLEERAAAKPPASGEEPQVSAEVPQGSGEEPVVSGDGTGDE